MKTLNKISQILAMVFGVGSLVLFFTPFVDVLLANGKETESLVGAQLAFGSGDLAVSGHVLFVFCFTVIAAIMGVFAYRAKGLRYGSSILGAIGAVYMWVIALAKDGKFFDVRTRGVQETNTKFVLITAAALTVFAIFAIAYLFIDDYLVAKASKDKKTICQRISLFFRDNKSEVKKIIWPGPRDVVKNTVTVLVMCLIIGALIWVVDFGLGKLLELIADLMSKKSA